MSTPNQDTSAQSTETNAATEEKKVEPVVAAAPTEKKEPPAEDPRIAELNAKLAEATTRAEKYAVYADLEELVSKGDVVGINRRLLKDKFGPDILLTLGAALAEDDDKDLPFEEKFRRARAAEQKAADDKKKAEDEAAAKRLQEDEDREFNAYMEKSAKFLTENVAKFPLCDALGVDAEDYGKRLYDFIDKNKRIPEPEELYAQLEAEKEAKLAKTKYAPPKAEPNGITYKVPEPIVPAGRVVFQAPEELDPVEEERRKLRGYDQAKLNDRTLRARA